MKYSVLFLSFFLSFIVYAGATRDGGSSGADQAMKRMQYMMQELNTQKAALEQEIIQLKKDNKELEKDLKKAKKEISQNEATIDKYKGRVAGLNNTVEKRDEKIDKREGQLRDVIAKYQDTVLVVQQLNGEKAELEETVAEKESIIQEQEVKNAILYKANIELMELYENKNRIDGLVQSEGFTGLKQVEIENILQEYKFKLQDGQIQLEEEEEEVLE